MEAGKRREKAVKSLEEVGDIAFYIEKIYCE
jgi:hypothetical protein